MSTGPLPQRFGRYLLEERIGRGGMAEVFRARIDEGAFRKPVCIKRILPHLAGQPGFVDMFRDEASLAARFSHANIVQVLDFGEQDGTLFMSLELIDGVSLDAALRHSVTTRTPLPVPVALHVAICMCRALHAAHTTKGDDGKPLLIVHRDVSPHNVMLGRDGSVRITDFGIARAVERLTRTNTGVVKGKPSYMAPEQALAEPSDHRVDQFATGIVLWEMLAGRPLFRGTSPLAVLDAVVQARVPALERHGVDADLKATLSRALARSPADRFPDMAALEKELEAALVRLRATPTDVDVRPVVEGVVRPAPRTVVDDAPTDDEGVAYAELVATSSSGVWQMPDPSAVPTDPGPPVIQGAGARATAAPLIEPSEPTLPAPTAPAPATASTQATPEVGQPPVRVVAQPRGVVADDETARPPPTTLVVALRSPMAIAGIAGAGIVLVLAIVLAANRDDPSPRSPAPRPDLCPASSVARDVAGAIDDRAEGRTLLARGDRDGARKRFEDALLRDPTTAWGYTLLAEALPANEEALRLDAIACACAIAPGSDDCRDARLLLGRRPPPPPHPEPAVPAVAPEPPRPAPTAEVVSAITAEPRLEEPEVPSDDRGEPAPNTAEAKAHFAVDAAIKEAKVLYLQGKYADALNILQPASRIEKSNATVWKLLGMNAQKLGRLTTMCRAYGELLRLQPTGPDAEQARNNRKFANCK